MRRFCLSLLLFILSGYLCAADWTMLVMMQADNDLDSYAMLDVVNEMAVANLTSRVNVLIQCDRANHIGTLRYKVEKNNVMLLETLTSEMGQNPENEVVDGMNWAVSSYPATHYLLNFWGHGSGILDPGRKFTKGILFDFFNDTYLDTPALSRALSRIKNNVLGGNDVDVVLMDACLMAMLEVGYEAGPYAKYLVASQASVPATGLDYLEFLNDASSQYLAPTQLATSIVSSYQNYYQPWMRGYTQSVMELSKLNPIKTNVNQIVEKFGQCKALLGPSFKSLITRARSRSLEFEYDCFIDLHNFYRNVLNEINEMILPVPEPESSPEPSSPPTPPGRPERPTPSSFSRPSAGGAQTPANPSVPSNPSAPGSLSSSLPRPPRPSISSVPSYSSPYNSPPPGYSQSPRPPRPPRIEAVRSLDLENLRLSSQEVETLRDHVNELKSLLSTGMSLIENAVIVNAVGPSVSEAKGISIYYPKTYIHNSYYSTNFAQDCPEWITFLRNYI